MIYGNTGDDTLNGGAGDDTLSGGAGADQFAFLARGGADQVVDFTVGEDSLIAAGFDAADLAAFLDLITVKNDGAGNIDAGDGISTLIGVAPAALSDAMWSLA